MFIRRRSTRWFLHPLSWLGDFFFFFHWRERESFYFILFLFFGECCFNGIESFSITKFAFLWKKRIKICLWTWGHGGSGFLSLWLYCGSEKRNCFCFVFGEVCFNLAPNKTIYSLALMPTWEMLLPHCRRILFKTFRLYLSLRFNSN